VLQFGTRWQLQINSKSGEKGQHRPLYRKIVIIQNAVSGMPSYMYRCWERHVELEMPSSKEAL
jgi:hypothetical protein